MTWTKQQCEDRLVKELERFERAVDRLVKVPLTQEQYDALVSFAYNCGEGNLQKSTLLKKVNAKDFKGAAAEFAKWNRGGGRVLSGLTRRRKAEAQLFAGLVNDALATAGAAKLKPLPMPQAVNEPKPGWLSSILSVFKKG